MNDITKMGTADYTVEDMTEIAERETTDLEARPIEIITAEILVRKARAGEDILGIGRCLIEAKEQLTHGEWLPWLAEKVEFSEASAQRFMRLAREYTNPSLVTDLGASKALVLLALPASERDDFVAEKHDIDGEEKTVAEMSKRELEKVIRERDEARKQVADLTANIETQLEEQRTVYDVDMADAQGRLQDAQAAKERADQEIADLKGQLEQLKNAPAQVVETVPDKAAITAAVERAEGKLKAKIEKAEKDKAKAEADKAKAEQELAAAKVAQEQAESLANQEKNVLKEQVEALQKKLAVASSSDMTVFRAYFDQTKENINKMAECIARMTEAGDADGAGRLKAALGALLDATREVLK